MYIKHSSHRLFTSLLRATRPILEVSSDASLKYLCSPNNFQSLRGDGSWHLSQENVFTAFWREFQAV
jgi:hypothetical protein